MKYQTQAPFIASYILLRKENKIALVLRSNTGWMNGYWGLPSGKVEKAEHFTEAAIREAKEEAGIDISLKDLKFLHVQHRINKDEGTEWVDVCFGASSWKGEPYNAEPDIHGELKWFDEKNLPENMVPSVRHLIEQAAGSKKFSEYVGI